MNKEESDEIKEKIGFILENDEIKLVLPTFIDKNFFDEKSIKNELFSFYRLFKKYRKDIKKQVLIKGKDNFEEQTELSKISKKNFSIIEVYFSLIEDYKANGLLLFNETKSNYQAKHEPQKSKVCKTRTGK